MSADDSRDDETRSDFAGLASLLKTRRVEFPLDRSAEAQLFQQGQRQFWQDLFQGLPSIGNPSQLVRDKVSQAVNQTNIFERRTQENKIVLTSSIPFLSEITVHKIRDIGQRRSLDVWAALAIECSPVVGDVGMQFLNWNFVAHTLLYLTGGIPPTRLESILTKVNSATDALNTRIGSGEEMIQAACNKAAENMNDFVKQRKEEITSFMESLSEDIKLKSSSSLWATRATWYRFGTAFWFVTFVLLACAIIFYFVDHIPDFVKDLPRESNGNFPYASVVLILVPVLGAAWLLRLISRFLNNNHMLADDARHRQVMTQTYLALVADKKSEVTEKDRLVMLSAIFRPLPGAQVDEVAPPSILDLLKTKE